MSPRIMPQNGEPMQMVFNHDPIPTSDNNGVVRKLVMVYAIIGFWPHPVNPASCIFHLNSSSRKKDTVSAAIPLVVKR